MSGDSNGDSPRRTVATFRRGWWPGWIWAVPIAAVGIVLWLSLRAISSSGTSVTVVFDKAAGMTANSTKVMYDGLKVGSLSDIHLDPDGRHVDTTLDIDDSVSQYLTSGTRFYLQGARPSLSDPASLKAIVSGPTIAMVPGSGKPARHFVGLDGPPPTAFAASVSYRLHFDGAVGGLKVGAPVTLRGFTVGDVTDVQLSVDAQTGRISTPVTIALDPTRFHIRGDKPVNGHWTPVMNAVLDTLVQHGLRAALTQSPPLIGSQQITLRRVADAAPARLITSGPQPEIPTVAGGGAGGLMHKLDKLPIDRIGDNVRAITAHLKQLVSSPKLEDSLDHLDHTLAGLDRTVHQVGPKVGPMIQRLRQAAGQIDDTARAARRVMGDSPASPDGNLKQTLNELTQAARAMRSLADYLDRHPEALLQGR